MLNIIHYIKKLAGDDTKHLIIPIVFSIIDSLMNSFMYGVMLFLLVDLSENEFTFEKLTIYTISLIVIFIIRCIVQSISFTKAQCTGADVTYKLRLKLANHLHKLNLGFFNKNSIGSITGVLLTDINDFEAIITHCLCDIIKVLSFTLISILVAFNLNIYFGFSLTTIIIIAFPLLLIAGKTSSKNSTRLRISNAKVISHIVEYVGGIKTFRLYNLIGNKFKRLDNSLQGLRKDSIKAEVTILPFALSFSIVTAFIIPTTIILGTYLFSEGLVDEIRFIVMILISVSVSSILNMLSSLYPQVKSITKASESILRLLEENELAYTKDAVKFENYDVEFSNVDFDYDDNIQVLKDISFKAKQGTTTALIGPSGSGKTTIVSLLSRFWDVKNGVINIGNENIKDISPDTLTQYISIVFQDVYLLNDTVFNNIALGKPNANRNEVIQAAKDAQCHDFIMKMTNGYDSVIGEGGSTLSGGEKQRISIARALLKNSPIVLLDETTSNLDADNEYEIQNAFHRLMCNKTVLVIAHRLSTIIDSDNIIVLDKGIIKEQGTHEKLLESKGWYYTMYNNQLKAQKWKVKV